MDDANAEIAQADGTRSRRYVRRKPALPKTEIVFAEFVSREHWDKIRIDGRTFALIPDESVKAELDEWKANPAHARACEKLYARYSRKLCSKHVPVIRRRRYLTILANAFHVRLLHVAGARGVLLQVLDPHVVEDIISAEQLVALTRAAWLRDITVFRRVAEATAGKAGVALGPTDIAALGGFTRQALSSSSRRRGPAAVEEPTMKVKGSRKRPPRAKKRSEKQTASVVQLDLHFGD